MNLRGQVMVEALGALGFLLLLFVCIVNIFLMSIDKIRSLDTVFHLARSQQVNRSRNDRAITRWCFPGGRWLPSRSAAVNSIAGPAIHEIVFPFLPHGTKRLGTPWTSAMRVPLPDPFFLNSSWPQAPLDPPPGLETLSLEASLMKSRAALMDNALLDAGSDVLETHEAERG